MSRSPSAFLSSSAFLSFLSPPKASFPLLSSPHTLITLKTGYLFNSSLSGDNKNRRHLQVFPPITRDIICSIIVHWNGLLSWIPRSPLSSDWPIFSPLLLSLLSSAECAPHSWEIKTQWQRVANHDGEYRRKRQKERKKTRMHQKKRTTNTDEAIASPAAAAAAAKRTDQSLENPSKCSYR